MIRTTTSTETCRSPCRRANVCSQRQTIRRSHNCKWMVSLKRANNRMLFTTHMFDCTCGENGELYNILKTVYYIFHGRGLDGDGTMENLSDLNQRMFKELCKDTGRMMPLRLLILPLLRESVPQCHQPTSYIHSLGASN